MEDLFETIRSMSDARTRRKFRAQSRDSSDSLAESTLREALGADLVSENNASSRDWADLDHAIASRSTRGSAADEFEYEDDYLSEGDRSFSDEDS